MTFRYSFSRLILITVTMIAIITVASNLLSQEIERYSVVSFNIQFLGNFKNRDNEVLANIMAPYDLVIIQELVAPPYNGSFPDGSPYRPDKEAFDFFEAMKAQGFKFVLSNEDTGTGDSIHRNSTATEWWVAFYKPDRVSPDLTLPNGFLAEDRSNNNHFERVPYAFAFDFNEHGDFVFISTHLQPGDSRSDQERRREELTAIAEYIGANDEIEKDFIILGDMNIKDCDELTNTIPSGFVSLNDECVPTNTNINGPKPYDHVMYSSSHTGSEIDLQFDLKVIDLIETVRPFWSGSDPYPGDPYDHNKFRIRYSDHHPVLFYILGVEDDD